jgi:Fic family protein
MQITFKPRYVITTTIANALLRIETVKERVKHLPLTPRVLASLRETMRLQTTHYSTMIEGNTLKPAEIERIIKQEKKIVGRKREEAEVKGYYCALLHVEQWAAQEKVITEKLIQTLHALVMAGGQAQVKPTPYRDGQNVIRDAGSKSIVYMPPEAHDVAQLMKNLVRWIARNKNIPQPVVAGIVHYQIATIHPYYDGNGRTARLLTTLILHLNGYDLKGLYALEAYYAQHLDAYYQALSLGPSHNYYIGRAEADITPWLTYFIEGMAHSFERVSAHMQKASQEGASDQSEILRSLDPRQRRVLELFADADTVTACQMASLFGFKPRTSAHLCQKWVDDGFLVIANPSNKARSYRLAQRYKQ